jgi:S-adenosylmethionine hydrolase
LEPVSATFHGRDLFAPVAARLALGEPLAEAGTPLEPAELVSLSLPVARVADGRVDTVVVHVDGFGNLSLAGSHADLASAGMTLGQRVAARTGGRRVLGVVARTFADVGLGDLLVYEDAGGALAVAVNGGDAATLLGVRGGDAVRLEPV